MYSRMRFCRQHFAKEGGKSQAPTVSPLDKELPAPT